MKRLDIKLIFEGIYIKYMEITCYHVKWESIPKKDMP